MHSMAMRMRNGRAPQGARGLKFADACLTKDELESRPARGAWIEMPLHGEGCGRYPVAPRKGRVD